LIGFSLILVLSQLPFASIVREVCGGSGQDSC
jgi:hypothetical protein